MTTSTFVFLVMYAAVFLLVPFGIEKFLGEFWTCVAMSAFYCVLSINAALAGHTVLQVYFLVTALIWGWLAWRDRHKRKELPLAQKLGYKAKALLAKLVAGMPKARPRFNPAISGGRA